MASAKSRGSVLMTPSPDASSARFVEHTDTNEQRRRVLIVGDDETSQRSIAEQLSREGYEVKAIPNDRASLIALRNFAPDLVVINAQQPESDGLTTVRYVRAMTSVPILILRPRCDVVDRLIGPDEYLSKPLKQSELVERVRALIGGDEAAKESTVSESEVPPLEGDLRFDDLVIRPRLHVVERDGRPIELSATEFDLLYFLAAHPRQVFTRQQLLDHVWHYEYFGDSNTVTVHMSRLRKKIEPDPANPRHLRTVWSVGYKFVP